MKKRVISIISMLIGIAVGVGTVGKIKTNQKDEVQSISDKHLALFLMMNQWVKIKQEGKNLAEYFERVGYKNIAVYGMSYVGQTLIDELKETGICVNYGIDKKADTIYADIDILSMDNELKKVDAVVVTAITFFDEIKKELSKRIDCSIISLEDILYEI